LLLPEHKRVDHVIQGLIHLLLFILLLAVAWTQESWSCHTGTHTSPPLHTPPCCCLNTRKLMISNRDSYTSSSSYSSLLLPEHKRVDDVIQGLIHTPPPLHKPPEHKKVYVVIQGLIHLLLFILLLAVAWTQGSWCCHTVLIHTPPPLHTPPCCCLNTRELMLSYRYSYIHLLLHVHIVLVWLFPTFSLLFKTFSEHWKMQQGMKEQGIILVTHRLINSTVLNPAAGLDYTNLLTGVMNKTHRDRNKYKCCTARC
jgi:hypothetical protein